MLVEGAQVPGGKALLDLEAGRGAVLEELLEGVVPVSTEADDRPAVVGEGLQRRLTQGGSTVTQRWAENVQGLSVQRISTTGVRLVLTYRDARGGLHPLETVVQLRLPRAWRAP